MAKIDEMLGEEDLLGLQARRKYADEFISARPEMSNEVKETGDGPMLTLRGRREMEKWIETTPSCQKGCGNAFVELIFGAESN